MLCGDVELHAMAHIKYLVHLGPRCTALLLDQLEEWWDSEHIVLDHVLAFDEVQHLSLGTTGAVYHTMDLRTKLIKNCFDDRSIGTRRREDQAPRIQWCTSDRFGKSLRATVDQLIGRSSVVALRVAL